MLRFIKPKHIVFLASFGALVTYGLFNILTPLDTLTVPSNTPVVIALGTAETLYVYDGLPAVICHADPTETHLLVNLRSTPGGEIVAGLEEGEVILVISSSTNGWSSIVTLFTKEIGYVNNSFICP